ncbi:MAG: DegT/DnrJ/EryC1/StrS family aminotransferase [Caldiserica bacterium]|nr:DegT/DnrJ/EryC1/StrS family aminotransferase [Caldisericota bacterium]
MKVQVIDLKKQNMKIWEELSPRIEGLFQESRFILGKEVEEFERNFASYCGTKFAVAVNSGTSALLLSLLAHGVGKGDEVITVPFTFIATVEAIVFSGAKPVFVDIDAKTMTIDVGKIEQAITPRTKAIIPVHLYGEVCDMNPLREIAGKYNLSLIEDACQAHGAEYLPRAKKAGSMGDCGCFSFYPSKNLSAWGEGGMVTTDDEEIAEKVKMLRDHGSGKKYYHKMIGLNCRMETLQGLVLNCKLKYLDEWNERRRAIARQYTEAFQNIDAICLPFSPSYSRGVYHLYVIRTSERDELKNFLQEKGVGTGLHYPLPLHLQDSLRYLGYQEGAFPVSERTAREIISLPLYPEMEEVEVKYVIDSIKEFFR